ncbi:MAG TPA: thiamine pyrophosphate-requiring protein [Geminicoccaceae bacterium]
MDEVRIETRTVAEALLALLKARGIDTLFANAGTDFAPVIEGLVRGRRAGIPMPEPITATHETVAVGMAHGIYLATGRPQAVMVHVNVGTANALMGLINAARDHVPIVFASGRTPLTEAGLTGSRDLPIHWGQEMFDQAGMLREVVKWDYELRLGEQLEPVVDRALQIALTPPRGPVYLSLPREVLAREQHGFAFAPVPVLQPPRPSVPDAGALDEAAALLARAERPLVIAARADAAAFGTLERLAGRFALPVVEFWPTRVALPTDHLLHGGFDVGPWLEDADVVLVLDSLVPWIPLRHAPARGCRVLQLGPDPQFSEIPMRGFRVDIGLRGDVAPSLLGLERALDTANDAGMVERRRKGLVERAAALRQSRLQVAEAGRTTPMSAAWISRCIDDAKGEDAVVVNELGVDPSVMTFRRAGSYFGHSLAGGLGWGVPAALGVQMADRDRLVIAAVGDGSYGFANPVACHQMAEGLGLPLLTVVFNNGVWNAVRKSTLAVYPDGHASRANVMPLSSLEPAPDYELIARASRAHAERVEDPDELPHALARAIDVIRRERRQALLNVVCAI